MESNPDIRRLLQVLKTLSPEEIRSNPQLAPFQNYAFDESPNIELATALKKRFDQYRKSIAKQPFTAHTKHSYESRINTFTGWLATADQDYGDFLTDPACRANAVTAYKEFLLDENLAPPNTVNAALAAIDHFCSLLGLERPGVQREYIPHHKLQALSSAQQAKLTEAADARKPQTAALVYLLLHTDLRISECRAIDLENLDLTEGRIQLVDSKGQPLRRLSINEGTCNRLGLWLDARAKRFADRKIEPAVFLNPQGKRMSEVAMRKIVRKAGQLAGLGDNLYPDMLRQTCLARRLRPDKFAVSDPQSNI